VLNTLFYGGLLVIGLFLAACLGIGLLMLFIVVTSKDEPETVPASRHRTSDVSPTRDDALFYRLVHEAMAYATRPYVTSIVDANGVFLLNTVSDAFGKRVYTESRRRVDKTLLAVICVYENGDHVPTVSVSTEIPVTRVDWPAHVAALNDVAAHGPKLSFNDERGLRREIRIPKQRSHHA